MPIGFEWDEEKASRNERKHGIRFAFATRVLLDQNRLEWLDTRRDYGEHRWKAERYEREDYWNR